MRASLCLLALGCATGAASSGTVTFKSVANLAARPVHYSVGKGHISGTDLDLSEDNGCVRGAWGTIPIDFCRVDKGEGPQQHWAGGSGDFTVAPAGENSVAVRGVLMLDTTRTVSMDQVVDIGQGAGWDELRKHPALLAVAATLTDLQVAGLRH
jgi:hypothetical protein